MGLKYQDSPIFDRFGGMGILPRAALACAGGTLGVEFRGSLAPFFFSTSINKKKLIKKEYCRCGPHPLQATSSRVRPPLVKGAGCIGPLFPEFHCWPLWFMASIALLGPQHLAPEVVPGASLHSEALSPECGRECQETGDCGPARHVGAGRWRLLGLTAHGLLGRQHLGPSASATWLGEVGV